MHPPGPRQHGRTSRRRLRAAPAAAWALLALLALPAGAGAADDPGGVIVRFRAGADAAERLDARRDAGVRVEARLPVRGMQLVDAGGADEVDAAVAALGREPGVLYAEPDRPRRRAAVVDDPLFGSLWGLDNTGQSVNGFTGAAGADADVPGAWALTRGAPGVVVGVVDSGVALGHPDLAPALWANPGESGGGRERNGADDDGNGLVDDVHGWDWVNGDASADDDDGHGSHVSGTIAARAGDGAGIAGVAPQARVAPLKVLGSDGSGYTSDLIAAYDYAAESGIQIVNASLGGDYSQAERDAIAAAPGVLFVVAAGNGGQDGVGDDNDDPAGADYPCAYPLANIVCVAASTQTDARAGFSNFGAATVDLAAPGTSILSTVRCDGATPRYAFYNGTSMATPHVAGAAALVLSAFPGSTPAQVKQRLLSTVDPRPAFAATTVSGGRLNAAAAVAGGAAGPVAAAAPAAGACETVAPPRDVAPPGLRVTASSTLRRAGVVRRRAVPVRLTCSERCSASVSLSIGRATAARLRLARRPVVLAGVTASLRPDVTRTLSLRLSRRTARALARVPRVTATLRVSAADVAGNRRAVRRTITIVR